MRRSIRVALGLLVVVLVGGGLRAQEALAGASADHVLWYRAPATDWEKQALPIGNGSLGGMVFGGVDEEHVQFNEDSLWIGDEQDTGAYQSFGDLRIALTHDGEAGPYRRELDVRDGVHRVRYARSGITFERVAFASRPAGVLVLRFDADRPGAHTGRIALTDAHGADSVATDAGITFGGALDGFVYGGGSTRGRKEPYAIVLDYAARLAVLHDGGSLTVDGDGIRFAGCDSVTLLLAAGTDYVADRDRGWKGEHPGARIAAQLAAAVARPFDALLAEHVADVRALTDRCDVDWGTTPEAVRLLATDARLATYRDGVEDPDLEELLFRYARYLMVASSRPGALPANLQGLWNRSNRPPWRSDYHTDVNVQMNYWFVDAANLAECFEPLAEWVWSIRGVRRDETAAAFGTRGWITHAENGIFGGSTWKWSKGDAAWVAQNLFDHWAFTQDRDYLEARLLPILEELSAFWVDHLKELPDGTLVSPDGFSPEHGPHEDGVSFDQQLVWDLFTNYLEASAAAGVESDFRAKVAAMRSRLLGPRIGRWGQLQEWMVDRDDPDDQHRHLSHMIAVHPGRQIAPRITPDLAAAARVSMDARGDTSTGWSRAWKISIRARLHQGDRAYAILRGMVGSMILDNLFNTHPPFQIDGNFGYAAGVCEMLLQSHLGEVDLLPALPAAWPDGSFRGLRARGGLEVDLSWKDGRAVRARLRATRDGVFRLRAPDGQRIAGQADDGPVEIGLKAGEVRDVGFEAATETGFEPMFGAGSLAGWQTTGNWIVDAEGVVRLEPRPGESGWQRFDAYLMTERTYADFELDLEFKFAPHGNSGVFMRVADPASPVDTGLEVQILDTFGKEDVGHHDCGGVIRTVGPTKNMVKQAGEWNRYRIRMVQSQLTVVLNGEQIVDVDLSRTPMKDRPLRGHIGFQDEGKRVWFRNVRIRELD